MAGPVPPHDPGIEENKLRLLKHFGGEGPPANDRWAALWDAGDFLPWDQGVPNPALVDVMRDRQDLVGDSVLVDDGGERRRKRALVPGCGRGYDVLLLSSLGYDAYGLEVSSKAVQEAQSWAAQHLDDYPVRDESIGRGKAQFIAGDFFDDAWVAHADGVGKFDFIYDYTFFCALAPSLRPACALRFCSLLASLPGSVMICVEFPTFKTLSQGGPPFAMPSSVYVAHLGHPGQEIPYEEAGIPKERCEGGGPGLQRVAHWKAVRSHPMGRDTDWVSVWKHAV
ncbi:putative thiol methyltransferase [Aspergillus heteromorphus CBS 117.55]|uniref:Putative thiol methyltransferase n=1 Tax=Aspergillus heteromorphus CBS 117.55 TaxID=1448321 RepID=A0A317VHV3_9EURO|nr:putative thiol methyltransferase [Aspergillus heteromorphus CBS 117.55]PWY73039.1 putative thiol methyltransferase [Aspergillus heteromorphus CBS 117.55]